MVNQRTSRWHTVNHIYIGLLTAAGLVWILQLHTFGITMGLVGVIIAYFMYQRNRWAYFAAAIWCFGLLRIAMDDDHNFHQDLQSFVKLPYLIAMVIAFVLHEKVALKQRNIESDNIPE